MAEAASRAKSDISREAFWKVPKGTSIGIANVCTHAVIATSRQIEKPDHSSFCPQSSELSQIAFPLAFQRLPHNGM